MKQVLQCVMASALAFAASLPLAVCATAQEPDVQKSAEAMAEKVEQAKKQLAEQHAKLDALRKEIEQLKAQRAELAKSKQAGGSQSKKVAGKTDETKPRAAAPQKGARAQADRKRPEGEQRKTVERTIVDLRKRGEELPRTRTDPSIRRSPQRERIVDVRPSQAVERTPGDRSSRQRPEGVAQSRERSRAAGPDRSGRPNRPAEVTRRSRVDVDRAGAESARRIEPMPSGRGGRSGPGSPGGPGPGPVEIHRRLQVLEDRLDNIERKLDRLLELNSGPGRGPDGRPSSFRGSGRGPGDSPMLRRSDFGPENPRENRRPGDHGTESGRRQPPGWGRPSESEFGDMPQMRRPGGGPGGPQGPRFSDEERGPIGRRFPNPPPPPFPPSPPGDGGEPRFDEPDSGPPFGPGGRGGPDRPRRERNADGRGAGDRGPSDGPPGAREFPFARELPDVPPPPDQPDPPRDN